jgi:hypothetical protein
MVWMDFKGLSIYILFVSSTASQLRRPPFFGHAKKSISLSLKKRQRRFLSESEKNSNKSENYLSILPPVFGTFITTTMRAALILFNKCLVEVFGGFVKTQIGTFYFFSVVVECTFYFA